MTAFSVTSTAPTATLIDPKETREQDFKFLQSRLKSCQKLETERKSSILDHADVSIKIAEMITSSNYTNANYELESIQKRLTVIQNKKAARQYESQQDLKECLDLDYFGLANRIRYVSYQYFPNTILTHATVYDEEFNTAFQEVNFKSLEQLFFSREMLTSHPLTLSQHILKLINHATNPRYSDETQSQAVELLDYFLRAGLGLPIGLKYAFVTDHPTNKEKIVRKLLEFGADPNESFWDITASHNPPLAHMIATSKNTTSLRNIVQELLNHGMNVNVRMDTSSLTSPSAIHTAIGVKRWDVITIYIYNSITIPSIAESDATGSIVISQAKAIHARALGILSNTYLAFFQLHFILEALPPELLNIVAGYFLDKKALAEQCYVIEEEDKQKAKANLVASPKK